MGTPKEKTGGEAGFQTFIPLIIAAIVTVIVGWYVYFLSQEWVVLDHVHATRLTHFLAGTPNDMAGTLGGLVGSLTLIWVIASVVQQSMELRAQRAEFAEMVRAQDAQVAALSAQADIFLDEQIERKQVRNDKVVDQELISLEKKLRAASFNYLEWQTKGYEDAKPWDDVGSRQYFRQIPNNIDLEEYLSYFLEEINAAVGYAIVGTETDSIERKPVRPTMFIEELVKIVGNLLKLKLHVSADQKIRLDRMKLEELSLSLGRMMLCEELWHKPIVEKLQQ